MPSSAFLRLAAAKTTTGFVADAVSACGARVLGGGERRARDGEGECQHSRVVNRSVRRMKRVLSRFGYICCGYSDEAAGVVKGALSAASGTGARG